MLRHCKLFSPHRQSSCFCPQHMGPCGNLGKLQNILFTLGSYGNTVPAKKHVAVWNARDTGYLLVMLPCVAHSAPGIHPARWPGPAPVSLPLPRCLVPHLGCICWPAASRDKGGMPLKVSDIPCTCHTRRFQGTNSWTPSPRPSDCSATSNIFTITLKAVSPLQIRLCILRKLSA